ncbi:MAG: NTP transferase domain-containing protein [candidate division WOR-3 bacterium]|nr:MAG: NTP transferase domain-containing protein [candidate division WOR-3 bacterium]
MATTKMPILHEKISTVILAAGVGKRMKSKIPKVLHRVLGKPIISFVRDLARDIGSSQIILVVNTKSDEISELIGNEVTYAIQAEPLGSGDAAKKGLANAKYENTLILCGDVPLLRKETILALIEYHLQQKADATLLTCELDNPYGYGRIIRNEDGYVVNIIEECDATAEQRQIREINAGVYYGKTPLLSAALDGITTDNKQGEYYLTDAIRNIVSLRKRVAAYTTSSASEIIGVNTQEHLTQICALVKDQWYAHLKRRGVNIEDPVTIDIDLSVKIGDGAQIKHHSLIEGDTVIRAGETVGPYVWIKNGKKSGLNKYATGGSR